MWNFNWVVVSIISITSKFSLQFDNFWQVVMAKKNDNAGAVGTLPFSTGDPMKKKCHLAMRRWKQFLFFMVIRYHYSPTNKSNSIFFADEMWFLWIFKVKCVFPQNQILSNFFWVFVIFGGGLCAKRQLAVLQCVTALSQMCFWMQ